MVDDGSTDFRARNYARNNSDLLVVHKENLGVTSSWQDGIDASDGEIICLVDNT